MPASAISAVTAVTVAKPTVAKSIEKNASQKPAAPQGFAAMLASQTTAWL